MHGVAPCSAITDHETAMPRRAQISSASRLQGRDRALADARRPGGGCRASPRRGPGSRCRRRAGSPISPTVATSPGSSFASRSAASTNSAAAPSASRRRSIGVVPAWPAWPVEDEVEARLAGDRGHDAEREALGLEHRALLDVDLEVRAGAGEQRLAERSRRCASPSVTPSGSRQRELVRLELPDERAAAEEGATGSAGPPRRRTRRARPGRRRRAPRPPRARRARRGCRRSGRRRRPSPGASR